MSREKGTIFPLALAGLIALAGAATAGTGGHEGVVPVGARGFGPGGRGGYGYRGYGYRGYGGWGYGFYGGIGFYPELYGYYPYGYYPYPYPYGGFPPPPPGMGPPMPTDNRCHIRVFLPPDATLWFENELATKTGQVRDFVSPEVTPGQAYTYTLKARWEQQGQTIEQNRQITTRANSFATVIFGNPPSPPIPPPQTHPSP